MLPALHAAGVTFPMLQLVVTQWVREPERSRAISFIFSGACGTLSGSCTC